MTEQDCVSIALSHDENGNLSTEELKTDALVPVSEAIKYRKRAQHAEQQVKSIQEQLTHVQAEHDAASHELRRVGQQQKLTQELLKHGVVDLEMGLLLAASKIKDTDAEDALAMEKVVGTLRRERPGLFNDSYHERLGYPSAGRKGDLPSGRVRLERMAQQAARSGSRRDVQDYLRFRRSMNHSL